MFYYHFELTPAKPNSTIDFCNSPIKEAIYESAEHANNGLAFKRDGKAVTIHSIETQRIMLTLSCKTALQNSARSLSSMTRYLISNYENSFRTEIYNKTLFCMNLTSQDSDILNINATDIPDAELVKGIIDLLYTYTSSTKKEELERTSTINKMKELIKPYLSK